MIFTSNSTMAFFMLSTSNIILMSSWTGLTSLDLVPALAVSLFTASSSCSEKQLEHRNKIQSWTETVGCVLPCFVCVFVCLYLSIVNLQWVKLIGVFGEVGAAPGISRLFLVHSQEVVQGTVLVRKFVQLVASDGGANSAP